MRCLHFFICPLKRSEIYNTLVCELACPCMNAPSVFTYSGHDFHLLTVMAVTSAGEGIPGAWVISSREDEAAVSVMVSGLKPTWEELGYQCPVPQYIMTDKAMAFYSGWVAATGQNVQHLLCSWHVVRAWKGKLVMIQVRVKWMNACSVKHY